MTPPETTTAVVTQPDFGARRQKRLQPRVINRVPLTEEKLPALLCGLLDVIGALIDHARNGGSPIRLENSKFCAFLANPRFGFEDLCLDGIVVIEDSLEIIHQPQFDDFIGICGWRGWQVLANEQAKNGSYDNTNDRSRGLLPGPSTKRLRSRQHDSQIC